MSRHTIHGTPPRAGGAGPAPPICTGRERSVFSLRERRSRVKRLRAPVCYSVLALCGLLVGGRADGQVGLTITPAMAKGAATAPVTIVEFSDYQ